MRKAGKALSATSNVDNITLATKNSEVDINKNQTATAKFSSLPLHSFNDSINSIQPIHGTTDEGVRITSSNVGNKRLFIFLPSIFFSSWTVNNFLVPCSSHQVIFWVMLFYFSHVVIFEQGFSPPFFWVF